MVALRAFAGAIVWALHFAVIYGATSLLCARGAATLQWLGTGVVTWSVSAATVVALLAVAAVFISARRSPTPGELLPWITAGVAALAALAIVWEALTALMVPACQ